MHDKWSERMIALSAIFQSASLVDTLAKTGHVNSQELQVMADSLFVKDPQKTIDVYVNIANLHNGVTALINMLERRPIENADDVLRYVMSLLHLQKKLSKHKELVAIIANRLDQANKQLEHFPSSHDNVIANLADTYTDTISTFRFRVQVMGDHNYLQQQRIANQIRVILFSGIRAAVLWKQLGGSRLHVIFYRRHLLQCLQKLKASMINDR